MDTLKIQCALHILDLPDGGRDGITGVNTETGIRRFQRRFGIPETGTADDDTIRALRHALCFGLPEGAAKEDEQDEWDELEYFTIGEFDCPCGRCGGRPVEPHINVGRGCDAIRKWAGVPISPNSGVRCQEHNDELPGSVPNSWHVRGPSGKSQAVDLSVRGKTDAEVQAYAMTLPWYYSSYIMSGGGVHIQFKGE